VERGSISVKVSASGAIASITAQNLGFPKGAQIKEINVHVGDTIRAGQVLARIDPFSFQQTLNQQQAQLQNQQAQLNKIINGSTVGRRSAPTTRPSRSWTPPRTTWAPS